MRMKYLIGQVSLLSLVLAGCAQPPAVPSPQVIVKSKNNAKIQNAIVRACDENMLHVDQQSENGVSCSGLGNNAAQMFLGYKNGSDVMAKYRFTWFGLDNANTKISGSAWYESQNMYGMTSQDNTAYLNQAGQSILNIAKSRIEGGRK